MRVNAGTGMGWRDMNLDSKAMLDGAQLLKRLDLLQHPHGERGKTP